MSVRSPSYCEGGAEARAEIRDFLRRRQKSIENEEVLEITLYESSKGQIGEPIEQYKLGFEDEQLEMTAREIVLDAEKNALVLRGRVKFQVKIEGFAPTLTFGLDVVRADDLNDEQITDDEDLDDLERPDKKGLVGMAMRHAEHSHKEMRAASRSIRETMRDLRLQLRETQDENRELRKQLRDGFRMEQELHNMDYLRRRDARREERSEERKDKLFATAEKMLPLVGAKLLGAGPEVMAQIQAQAAGPPPATAADAAPSMVGGSNGGWSPIERRSAAIIDMLQKLPEDKQGLLLQILPAELLMEMQGLHQDVQQKRGADGTPSGPTPSPSASANGHMRDGSASAFG